MRLKGMSYSQIKSKVKVSKSTLSVWLEKYPLSPERIRQLRDLNPQRIENCRNTKLRKRQLMLDGVYSEVAKDIGLISKRDLFIAGLFLYWGEGTKASRNVVAFSNTDPSMNKFFIKWLKLMGVEKRFLKIKLHLYVDMNVKKETMFWAKELDVPISNFVKPYIKDSKLSSLTYKNSFSHGTCNIIYSNAVLHNKIMMSLKYLRDIV